MGSTSEKPVVRNRLLSRNQPQDLPTGTIFPLFSTPPWTRCLNSTTLGGGSDPRFGNAEWDNRQTVLAPSQGFWSNASVMSRHPAFRLCRAVFSCLVPPLLLAGPAPASETQSWFGNSLTFGLSDAWRLEVTQELRSDGLDYGDRFLRNWSLGAARSLPRNTYLGVSFKRERADKVGFTRTENRLTLEGGWKKVLLSGVSVDTRFRSEIRRFENDRSKNHIRYRVRARLRRKLEVFERRIGLFVWSELFGKSETVDRNRFSLGTTVRLVRHTEVLVAYLRQDTDDKGAVNALKTGFKLSF